MLQISILFFKHKNNALSQLKVSNNCLMLSNIQLLFKFPSFYYIFTVCSI